jgi:adenine-specific DNA-methyltransferase
MTKKDYSTWSKDELIKEIVQLENRKKYGLVWEDKLEDVVEKCKIELPVLEEVQGKEILKDRNSPFNLIIEGDNYHALSVLNYTHNGKIDVIYIDPPFNTGARDWKYNNDYVDINDQWRHSKWISFMRNRLTLTKHLLSKDGVMIIAIDDNELCSLGLLIDEIFPNKDRNTVVIVSNPHGVSRSGFSRCHEYALFLLNPGRIVNKKPVPEDSREINLRRSGNNSLREDSPTMFYPIFVDKKTNKIIGAGEVPKTHYHPPKRVIGKGELYEVWPIDNKGEEKNWYYSRKRVIENGNAELFCKWVKNQLHVYCWRSRSVTAFNLTLMSEYIA